MRYNHIDFCTVFNIIIITRVCGTEVELWQSAEALTEERAHLLDTDAVFRSLGSLVRTARLRKI